MNILVCTFSFPSIQKNVHDGRFVLSEVMGYAENGADVRVLTPHYPGAPCTEKIHERVTVYRFRYFMPERMEKLKKPGEPIYEQRSFLSVLQIPILCLIFMGYILRHGKWADIIHAQWTLTALLSLPARWFRRPRVVVTARGSDLRLMPAWLNRFIHSRVDAAMDCFGPQSWRDEYIQNFPARYIRLPHLVHRETEPAAPKDMLEIRERKGGPFVILYVGRFDPIKIRHNRLPLFTLTDAAAGLKARGFNFHIFYLGGGELEITQSLAERIEGKDLEDDVTTLGARINVMDYMSSCDIGVGGIAFNAVSQEFTISGKPQILVHGFDNRGTPWRHRENCLLVKPDDVEDLTENLMWAIQNRDALERIGQRARNEMDCYFTESVGGGSRYLEAFRKLSGQQDE